MICEVCLCGYDCCFLLVIEAACCSKWQFEGFEMTLSETAANYRGADKYLARPTSRSILFDGENISFDASLYIYIYITNIPPIMIINRIYERQTLSLSLVSFLVWLRTYQHQCTWRNVPENRIVFFMAWSTWLLGSLWFILFSLSK
jgi:hypothetical protein